MRVLKTLVLFSFLSIITFSQAQNTTSCEDFEGYILTYPSRTDKTLTKYWYVLRFNGVLSEDCQILYQTANKNTKFEFRNPKYPSRKILEKGKREYMIYDNGFFYGNYKDRHRVISYPVGKKPDNPKWTVTSDKKEKLKKK